MRSSWSEICWCVREEVPRTLDEIESELPSNAVSSG
jgi:hypothetical protein